MAEPDGSDTISPRRRLLEEVLKERSRAVAGLPLDEQDPPASSFLWPLGVGRMAFAGSLPLRERALSAAVVALAWLEACDELPAEAGAGRE